MKGFASLVLLLITALIMVILFVAILKLMIGKSNMEQGATTANPKDIQKQIDQYQQKSIENQKINVE